MQLIHEFYIFNWWTLRIGTIILSLIQRIAQIWLLHWFNDGFRGLRATTELLFQALCLSILSLSQVQNTFLFTYGYKAIAFLSNACQWTRNVGPFSSNLGKSNFITETGWQWWIDALMESGQDVRHKIIRQSGTAFLNLLSLTFRLTNAKFSGSRRPGRSRPAPCSFISEQSESVSCSSTELHHSSSWYRWWLKHQKDL